MKRCLTTVFSALFLSVALFAGDLTITMKSQVSGFMGRSSQSVETHYYTAKFMRSNNPTNQMDTLMDYGSMTMYTINHKKHLIQKMTLQDAMDAMSMAGKKSPEGMSEMMNKMFGDPNNFKVTEQGHETVAGHACTKYRIQVGKILMDTSNDPNLKPPVPEATFAKMIKMRGAMMAAMPSGKGFVRLYEEMSKIKGMALKTHMTGVMGMDTLQEATSVKEGPIPESTFALPSGYQMEDTGAKLKAEMAKQH